MADGSSEEYAGVAAVGIGAFILFCLVATAANPLALFYTALGVAYFLILGCLLADYYVCLGVAMVIKALGETILPESLFELLSDLVGLVLGLLGALSTLTFLVSFLYFSYRFGVFGIGVRTQDLVKNHADALNQIALLLKDTWHLITTSFITFGFAAFTIHPLKPTN